MMEKVFSILCLSYLPTFLFNFRRKFVENPGYASYSLKLHWASWLVNLEDASFYHLQQCTVLGNSRKCWITMKDSRTWPNKGKETVLAVSQLWHHKLLLLVWSPKRCEFAQIECRGNILSMTHLAIFISNFMYNFELSTKEVFRCENNFDTIARKYGHRKRRRRWHDKLPSVFRSLRRSWRSRSTTVTVYSHRLWGVFDAVTKRNVTNVPGMSNEAQSRK